VRILLVDDDAEIRIGFTAALIRRGHEVTTAGTVAEARVLAATAPDIGIIDVMLPDGDGFSLCREIRARWHFPTLMLTARDDESDMVGGLEAGADDYVVKPVSAAVLEARLRAIIRRQDDPAVAEPAAVPRQVLRAGDVQIDESAMEVRVGDSVLPLSVTEYRLLVELVHNRGNTLTRQHLIDEVWHESPPNTPRVVDTTIQRLRSKLADHGVENPRLHTLRGFGYRLEC
jgi:DNA-binding response OmpR family regulator